MLRENSPVSHPSRQLDKSHGVYLSLLGGLLIFIVLVALYFPVFNYLLTMWRTFDDYQHGFLVPLFSAYLLWSRRGELVANYRQGSEGGILLGCSLLFFALFIRLSAVVLDVPAMEAVSLIVVLAGVTALTFGTKVLRIAAPAILFLFFMVPLPSILSSRLSSGLQYIATSISTFTLQSLGVPATAEGNIIWLTDGSIGVAEACSGIRMLFSFFALTVGACMLIDRTWPEKLVIALSAIPIAIAANCIRIILTGLAYEYLDSDWAEHIFHDFAGVLMMFVGLALLVAFLGILDRLVVPAEPDPSPL